MLFIVLILALILIAKVTSSVRKHTGASKRSPRNAALIALFKEPNRPVMCQLVKLANYMPDGGTWTFPGGIIDATDESAKDAAMREYSEEVGVMPKVKAFGPSFIHGDTHIFIALVDGQPITRPLSTTETTEGKAVPIEKIYSDVTRPCARAALLAGRKLIDEFVNGNI